LAVCIGLALCLPAASRADAATRQWTKARATRGAAWTGQETSAAAPSKLKWRSATEAAGKPSPVERAVATDEADAAPTIVLTKATTAANDRPVERAIAEDEKIGEQVDEPAPEHAPALRLLADDDDDGELVPIASDDDDAQIDDVQADDAPSEETPDEPPARPMRRPADATDIEAGDDTRMTIGDELAMEAMNPSNCPTVKTPYSEGGFRSISDITNQIDPEPGNFPQECPLGGDPYKHRDFAATDFTWRASALCHKPLYFEDVQLERYGHTYGPVIQPCLSMVKFYASVICLPYKMGVEPPLECVYVLGYYRPGSCAPRTIGPIPISLRGTLVQLGASTGLTYLFP
jgi:hypothetical protein